MYDEQEHLRDVEKRTECERRAASPHYARMQDLLEMGVAVYTVGNLFETDGEGKQIPASDREKWFVSVPSDSPHVSLVAAIPLATTEEEAWVLASQHLPASTTAGDQ